MKKVAIKNQSSFCFQCGICCKLFLINLSHKEWSSQTYDTELKEMDFDQSFKTIQKYGGNIVKQNPDGSCIYLENNLCSIHLRRPKVCKDFFCASKLKKYSGMIKEINDKTK